MIVDLQFIPLATRTSVMSNASVAPVTSTLVELPGSANLQRVVRVFIHGMAVV